MSAERLIFRIVVFPVLLIVVGVFAVFAFNVLEPMLVAFNGPLAPEWEEPGANALTMASFAFLGVIVVLIIHFVASPIQSDVRQQVR